MKLVARKGTAGMKLVARKGTAGMKLVARKGTAGMKLVAWKEWQALVSDASVVCSACSGSYMEADSACSNC